MIYRECFIYLYCQSAYLCKNVCATTEQLFCEKRYQTGHYDSMNFWTLIFPGYKQEIMVVYISVCADK